MRVVETLPTSQEHCSLPTAHCPLRPAFTLLEIVLVLIILSLMMLLAVPSLAGWGQGAKLDDVASRFVATARLARSQAIASGETHRILVDAGGAGYRLVRIDASGNEVAVDGDFGSPVALPAGFTLRVAGGLGNAIEFQPNARATPATVRITSPRGHASDIVCSFPADQFRVAAGGAR